MTSWLARYQTALAAERRELCRAGEGRPPAPRGPEDAPCVVVVAHAGGAALLDESVEAALSAAFTALGSDWDAVRVVPATRGGDEPRLGWARILAWEIEVVDPEVVLALGDDAAAVLSRAWPGRALPGRAFVALPDPTEALKTQKGKRRLWEGLRAAKSRLPDVPSQADPCSSAPAAGSDGAQP